MEIANERNKPSTLLCPFHSVLVCFPRDFLFYLHLCSLLPVVFSWRCATCMHAEGLPDVVYVSVRPSISRTPERRKDKADDPSPSTLLCFFCCFCFHPLRCFFSSLHQNHFQLARDSDRLCSVSGQEDFQATFQAMMNAHHCPVHCSHVRLFTVSQIPMNYLFSRNNHWNKKTKQS